MVFHLQQEGTEPLVFGRTKLTNHVALQWQELVRIQLVVFRELLRTLFVDPLSRAMYSSDGPDFEFVQQKRKEGLSIHEAVWQLAWKKSGPEMASLEAWLEEHEKYRSVA